MHLLLQNVQESICVSINAKKIFLKGFVFSTSYEYMLLLSFQGPGLVGCPCSVLF